jgi:hypothetical protein
MGLFACSADRLGLEEELLVLGISWEHAERTKKSFLVSLSFLKASYNVFEEAGIPKREGFDLFKPDQLICLTMGSMNVLKFGSSVSLK